MSTLAEARGGTATRRDDRVPLVSLQGVSKAYANGTVALRNANFVANQGEFISLVGPSGCGKSTILRIVAGLGPTSAGEVRMAGLPPERARRERGDMAFVFQDATLLPWRTVRATWSCRCRCGGSARPRAASRRWRH